MVEQVDIEVGAKIRAARVARGMSQTDLGAACGITFQQIQKYEKGTNRVWSSRLVQIARALGVPAGRFFDQYSGASVEPLFSQDAAKLAREFDSISSPHLKTIAMSAVRAILAADEETKEAA